MWGKKETVVSEEVEDRDYKDNGLLGQPNKPLNREAHLSNRGLSRPKEETQSKLSSEKYKATPHSEKYQIFHCQGLHFPHCLSVKYLSLHSRDWPY